MTLETVSRFAWVKVENSVLDRLLHCFNNLSKPSVVFRQLLEAAEEAIPCEAASLLLVTGEDGEMTFVAATGPVAEKIQGMKLKPGQGIAGACARDRATLTISDVQKEPRFAREISQALGFETRSLLAVPILHQGDLAGVLELVNKRNGDDWTRSEVELVQRVARVAGTVINLIGERS
jgi:GAF domain-containing protein